jgi:hypothetical protein
MPANIPKLFNEADRTHFLQVMQKTLKAVDEFQQSCWTLDDTVRPLIPEVVTQKDACLQAFAELNDMCRKMNRSLRRLVDTWARAHDAAVLEKIANTPEQEAQLRTRIAQADQSLKSLYPQLLALCQQAALPVQQEWQTPLPQQPLHDGRVHVALDYTLDEADAQFDEDQDNTLARQKVLSWFTGLNSAWLFDPEDEAMRINDNWLDYKHPWMSQQCWLSHDVLEHNYGQNPRMGVAALLRTGRIYVDVHSVRSYVFDLQQGRFVERPAS